MTTTVRAADFVIEHADVLATCAGPAPRRGARQNDLSPIASGAVASFEGRIVFVGPQKALASSVAVHDDAVRIDAGGCTVIPGFVDPHTHPVFAGDRSDELRQRLSGATYAEIAAAGGGILRTVAATRAASEEQLAASARERLDRMLATGTTTAEGKSGYGLTVEAELRLLHVLRRLDEDHPIDLVATFLGAHEVPPEYRDRRTAYVSLVTDEMIPAVAAASLAEWCDVFCEAGAFTPEESLAILTAGARAGLKPRLHADELAASGGARVAVQLRARSADHLIFTGPGDIKAMAAAEVCAVLLPATALFLKLGRFAPARAFIESGVPVALGTDMNPGTGLSSSMPFAMMLGCFAMDMTLEETLVAATLNAAWSLDRSDSVGSLEIGKRMDAVVIDGELTSLLQVGAPVIRTVVKNGRIVVGR